MDIFNKYFVKEACYSMGFPGSSTGKESSGKAGVPGLIPG